MVPQPHSQSGHQSTFGDGMYTWPSTGARTRTRADEGIRQIHYNRSGSSARSPQPLKKSANYWASSLSLRTWMALSQRRRQQRLRRSTSAVAFWCSEAESCKAGSCGGKLSQGVEKNGAQLFVRSIGKIQITSAQPPRRPTPQHPTRRGALARAANKAAYAAAPDNKRALARAASEVAFDAAAR